MCVTQMDGGESDDSSVTGGQTLDARSVVETATVASTHKSGNESAPTRSYQQDPAQSSIMSAILGATVSRDQMLGMPRLLYMSCRNVVLTLFMLCVGIMNLTETIENDLPEPAKTGLLFIRLLVKSVSDLCKEEDVERLLINNLALKFRTKIIRYERQQAIARLRNTGDLPDLDEAESMTTKPGSHASVGIGLAVDEVRFPVESKIFTAFICSLLSHSVSCLRRVSFVLRLLFFGKVLRIEAEAARQAILDREEEDDDDDEDVNNKPGSAFTHAKRGIVQAPSSSTTLSYVVKEVNRGDVRAWWDEIEALICDELQLHFKERAVENITDQRTKASVTRANQSKTKAADPDEDAEADDDGISSQPIVSPTARLAAPLYKKVVDHFDSVSQLLVEEGWYQAPRSSRVPANESPVKPSSNSAQSSVPFASKAAPTGSGMTILQRMAQEKELNPIEECYRSPLLDYLDGFVESELLPITQSYVNSEMRELQTNPALFNYDLQVKDQSKAGKGTTKQATPNKNLTVFLNQTITMNSASLSVAKASQLCYNYWYELPRHQTMVSVILDRLVRGFVGSAREEIENIGWKSLSFEDKYKTSALVMLQKDPLFAMYRKKLYRGRLTLDAYISNKLKLNRKMASEKENMPAAQARRLSLTSISKDLENAMDFSMWGVLFGHIGGNGGNYPVTKERLVRDFSGLGTMASVSLGCDWLSYELIK